MIEVTGNLWEFPAQYRVVTTNGSIRANGYGEMGAGCALEARIRFPDMPKLLGRSLGVGGNRVVFWKEYDLITFPVKHQFYQNAQLDLIAKSVRELHVLEEALNHPVIVMPRAGCGYGHLQWEDVKPLLQGLPDNIHVITWEM